MHLKMAAVIHLRGQRRVMHAISVIIPCFNAETTLARTLDSVVAQQEATQILVIDDGSQDTSPDIAAHYAKNHMPAN